MQFESVDKINLNQFSVVQPIWHPNLLRSNEGDSHRYLVLQSQEHSQRCISLWIDVMLSPDAHPQKDSPFFIELGCLDFISLYYCMIKINCRLNRIVSGD